MTSFGGTDAVRIFANELLKQSEKIVHSFTYPVRHLTFPNSVFHKRFRNVEKFMIKGDAEPQIVVNGHPQVFIEPIHLSDEVPRQQSGVESNKIVN